MVVSSAGLRPESKDQKQLYSKLQLYPLLRGEASPRNQSETRL
jgi:hypothetical protein